MYTYLKDNPEADIEEEIAFTREILDQNKNKYLLKHVLMDGFFDFPKSSNHLHLSCMKVFQIFFNSSNGYDSNTEMLEDIKKAIYIPLEVETSKPVKPLPLYSGAKMIYPTMNYQFKPSFNYSKGGSFAIERVSMPALRNYGHGKMFMLPKIRFSFP